MVWQKILTRDWFKNNVALITFSTLSEEFIVYELLHRIISVSQTLLISLIKFPYK